MWNMIVGTLEISVYYDYSFCFQVILSSGWSHCHLWHTCQLQYNNWYNCVNYQENRVEKYQEYCLIGWENWCESLIYKKSLNQHLKDIENQTKANSEGDVEMSRTIDIFVNTMGVLQSQLGYSESCVSGIEHLNIQLSKQKQSKAKLSVIRMHIDHAFQPVYQK